MSGRSYRRLRGDGLLLNRLERDKQEEGIEEFFREGDSAVAVSEGFRVHDEDFTTDVEEEYRSHAEEDALE